MCKTYTQPACTSTDQYLELVKRCLVNSIYADPGKQVDVRSPRMQKLVHSRNPMLRRIVQLAGPLFLRTMKNKPYQTDVRDEGRDWPADAHTMIGRRRLDALQSCIEKVLRDNVAGDLIETGVWRGGATILMRATLKANNISDRCVWVADSFEGLPRPNTKKYVNDKGDRSYAIDDLAVPLETVQDNFRRYDLLDDQVRFLKGWFSETLPAAPIKQLALIRIDGDMYESTMDALVNLYPKLSVGGYVLLDDYGALPASRAAVDEFRQKHGITDKIEMVDWTGAIWRRT